MYANLVWVSQFVVIQLCNTTKQGSLDVGEKNICCNNFDSVVEDRFGALLELHLSWQLTSVFWQEKNTFLLGLGKVTSTENGSGTDNLKLAIWSSWWWLALIQIVDKEKTEGIIKTLCFPCSWSEISQAPSGVVMLSALICCQLEPSIRSNQPTNQSDSWSSPCHWFWNTSVWQKKIMKRDYPSVHFQYASSQTRKDFSSPHPPEKKVFRNKGRATFSLLSFPPFIVFAFIFLSS